MPFPNKKIFAPLVFVIFLMSCTSEAEIGTPEWCEKIKENNQSDLTPQEKESLENCVDKPADELIIGLWKLENIEVLDHLFADKSYKLDHQFLEFTTDGTGKFLLDFTKSIPDPDIPSQVENNFKYKILSKGKEIKFIDENNLAEYVRIDEISNNKLVTKAVKVNSDGFRENIDDSIAPVLEYKKVQ